MDLIVREARPGDAEAVVGILNPIIEARLYTAFDSPFSIEEERAYIESFPAKGVFLLALDKAEPRAVGFQSMEPGGSLCGRQRPHQRAGELLEPA